MSKSARIFLFFSICLITVVNIYGQNGSFILTKEQMKSLASKIIKIEVQCYRLYNLNFTELISAPLDTTLIMGSYSFLDVNIKVDILRQNYFQLNSVMFYYGYELYTMDGFDYVVAVSGDGRVFFLSGFKRNDFNRLLKAFVKNINNKKKAVAIAELYLYTEKYYSFELDESTIIDSHNYNRYKEKYPNIRPPFVTAAGNRYNVVLYSLRFETGTVSVHTFQLSATEIVKYESRKLK